MTEMWERFSYYGIRALLILYMTASVSAGGMGFPVAKAGAVYGFYTAMAYLLALPGGWVADRMIGQQQAVLYGGILIALGNFSLTLPTEESFYVGLGLLMLGTGLLKPNVSTIVGQIYAPGDKRRDAGFSIFYMGINTGALIAPIICGWFGERVSWRLGFGVAGIGMTAGLIQYALGRKHLGTAGLAPADRSGTRRSLIIAGEIAAALALLIGVLAATGRIEFTAESVSLLLGWALTITCIAVFGWLLFGRGWSAIERKRSAAILVLFIASILFWSVFEQAGSSLNLFAERSTNRNVMGFEFPASWLQFVNSFFLILLAPVFAWLWIRLGPREPSSPAKFSFGLICAGLGFVLLILPSQTNASGVLVSPMWLIGTYFLHTVGELCLSPVGLSAITKLAPERVAGFMMGLWFVSISMGNYLAGMAASFYESMPLATLFGTVAAFVMAVGFLLTLLIRPTVRLMSGVK
jgi:POT family proton-dependent oligopeptide transporter